MRLTILHSHFTAMGGAEVLLATQARWLAAAGHEVRIAAFRVDDAYPVAHLAPFGVDVIPLPSGVAHPEALRAGQMEDVSARTRAALRGSDAVLAYNFPAAPIAAALDAGMRRVWYACEPFRPLYPREASPFASEHADRARGAANDAYTQQVARRARRRRWQHALLPWTGTETRALRAFDARGVNALDAVVSLSRYGAACVQQATGRTDVGVIYPMVNFAEHAPARHGIRRRAPQLLAQSRIGGPKNLDSLVRAMAIVRRTHGDAVLHIVGGGSRTALERLASDVAPNAIRFHGFLPAAELDALAAECDVFAFAPIDEPFGMVFPEAATRGLLLVGSDHGGPREILEDGAVGELCNPFEAESIASAILRTLAMSDAEADARRIAADASMRARFSGEVVGAQLEQLLRG